MTQAIAQRVLRLRKDRRLSGAALGRRVRDLGVATWTDSTISKLETGRRESVSASELIALAVALGVPADVLLLGDQGSLEADRLLCASCLLGRSTGSPVKTSAVTVHSGQALCASHAAELREHHPAGHTIGGE